MICPRPDPDLPFLGVHYTRRTDDKVIIGPNAVLAFDREAYENTPFDISELLDTLGFEGFWKLFASPKMISVGITELNKFPNDGTLIKDLLFEHGPCSIHVLNAVSPGLTSSLPFGEYLASELTDRFESLCHRMRMMT
ncbi:hypothetical protein ACFQH2_09500 [Natronoarchaeum sp. GCM10025703]|uniref:hypothetical protein n=1 Tax=unclassified Natronoarchaeum TaxID=2620183 RepID=UPI003623C469